MRLPERAARLRWAVVLAAAGIYLWLHSVAGLTFPVPWPDEASFLWPAIAVERTGSLFAPQLNPERHVLWMPPGYMVFSGLVFEITGFSLSLARALSCVYLLASFVLLVGLTGKLRLASCWAFLAAAFLLSRHWVFSGNVARMEAMLILLACGGFWLLARGRFAAGAGLAGMAPLIHPNGLFVLGGVAGMLAGERLRGRLRLRVTRAVVVGALLLVSCWLAYLGYVLIHWDAFLHDMRFQTEFKGYSSQFLELVTARVSRPWHVVACALALGGMVAAYRGEDRLLPLAWLAGTTGAASALTWGFNYTVYESLFFFCSLVLGGEALLAMGKSRRTKGARPALGFAALALALFGAYLAGYVESPAGYPERMSLYGLRLGTDVPYVTGEERQRIRRLLESVPESAETTTVRFYPSGDGLLFADLDGERLRIVAPTFHVGRADVHVVHRSRHIPQIVDYFTDVQLREEGFSAELRELTVLAERDGTERWLWARSATEERGPEP